MYVHLLRRLAFLTLLTASFVATAGVKFPIPERVQTWPVEGKAAVGVKAIWIEGVPWKGKPTRVFAYYALPKGATAEKKVPGIVLVHGGGGTAFDSWVRTWVSRGYAAIAMDNCGGIPGGKSHCMKHPRHEWSGPNGWGCFKDENLPAEDQWMYHAVEAVIRSHTFLRSLPEVDAGKIGVTGISWGGVLTSVVCGVDPRFAFAVPVYGCGNLRGHSVWTKDIGAKWDELWDPVQYAAQCHIPTLWCTGTNDHFFPLDSFAKTAFATGKPLFCIRIRMPHGHPPTGDPAEIRAFADSIVRGKTALDKREIVSTEWLSTVSADANWEARPFVSSVQCPTNATVFFRNVKTKDGFLLSDHIPAAWGK